MAAPTMPTNGTDEPTDFWQGGPVLENTAVARTQSDGTGVSLAPAPVTNPAAALSVEAQRAIAEIHASMVMAKQFPRQVDEVIRRIRSMCERRSLATVASYSFQRGGEDITGPTVQLLKAIAQQWGNIEFGVTELSRKSTVGSQIGESVMLAYAVDLESGAREKRIFTVLHKRDTRSGGYALKEERDIYELTANMGSRRLRACLEGVIPVDVLEIAIDACNETMSKMNLTSPDMIERALKAAESFKITRERIEAKWGRRMEAASPSHMIRLRKTFEALRDGMITADEAFPPVDEDGKPVNANGTTNAPGAAGLRDRLAAKRTPKDETPKAESEPGEDG